MKQQLVDAISMLERAGIIDFNGHVSVRVPGTAHVLINSGASVRSAMTVDDIITIDMDGQPVGGAAVPPMEFHMHTEIYRVRPDVQAVVHAHPLWSTVLGMAGHRIRPVIMQAAVMGEVRHFEPIASVNSKALGERLAAALGDGKVVTLQSHGAVAVGANLLEAFVLAVYLEETAQRQYLAMQTGAVRELSPDEIAVIGKNLWKPNLLQKVWDFHRAKL
ncbi:MAG: class II aldolase [Acidocella sp. 20-57-95]|nr:MAG: class II aldolase [Acidocella sp. 20-57-95]HQT63190.1 class II aldolase/adducin family protein [Acidocella sp.]HQU05208.1 class II aldolase/adducin family protein [Acidocella sp.]